MYDGYSVSKSRVSLAEPKKVAADMGSCGSGAQKKSSSLRAKPYGVSGAVCFLFSNSMAEGMAVTGVVGVVTPLDLPESHPGESPKADDVKDGRRSAISEKEKLSDSDGQLWSEYLLQSVSSDGGRCSSKEAPRVAMSKWRESDGGGDGGDGGDGSGQGLAEGTLLLPYTSRGQVHND